MEHIGVLGTGDVGRRLASAFRSKGHAVSMGTRDPTNADLVAWCQEHDVGPASFADAAAACDVAVLCTAWSGTRDALDLAERSNLHGKIVIDVTNPLRHTPDGPELAIGHTDSAGESVQRWLPDSSVVKCWNLIGNPYMTDPAFEEGPPTMWLCGEDETSKQRVQGYLETFGWRDVVDLGPITASRYLEPMAMVWILTGARTGHWRQAFRMLRA